jgi:hypothetical protein
VILKRRGAQQRKDRARLRTGLDGEGAADEESALSLEIDLNHLPQRKRVLA